MNCDFKLEILTGDTFAFTWIYNWKKVKSLIKTFS